MKIIETEKIPIKMWLEEIDDNAMDQVKNLANLPFAFSHIAIMPDSHSGYGMPIGGVLATKVELLKLKNINGGYDFSTIGKEAQKIVEDTLTEIDKLLLSTQSQ